MILFKKISNRLLKRRGGRKTGRRLPAKSDPARPNPAGPSPAGPNPADRNPEEASPAGGAGAKQGSFHYARLSSMRALPVCIACDHAGFPLKKFLMAQRPRLFWRDLGPLSAGGKTDYPVWAEKLCRHIQPSLTGVLICGSGQGMAVQANRFPSVRAALCWNAETARLARSHNHANILCLGARTLPFERALEIFDVFMETPCDLSSSHSRRVSHLTRPII